MSTFSKLLSRIFFQNKNQHLITANKMGTNIMSGEFPKTLSEFGYGFNSDCVLKKIDQNSGKLKEEGFEFNISSDHSKNQRHYDALGEVITDHVYKLLEENEMYRIIVTENLPKEQAPFIFCSKEKLEAPKKLLILIHGSGVVRAGQWARSLIINQSLNHGTQIPYIRKAKELGYEVLITNGNDNYRTVDGITKAIPGHSTPTAHCRQIWEKFVIGSNPDSVAIVAHSYGGVVTMDLAEQYPEFFRNKVFAIGFTDSVHSVVKDSVRNLARNFVTSQKKLGEELSSNDKDVPRYSAGHIKHEWTSYTSMPAIFDYIELKYKEYSVKKAEKQKI